jgi:hypothetical protein
MKWDKKLIWMIFLICVSIWGSPYTDNGNGTVTDSATGLVWQKCSAGDALEDCSGSDENNRYYSWSKAISYCELLILGGISDWRLPNINELRSIADYSKSTAPKIDTSAFPNTSSSRYYFSSTHHVANTWRVMAISFNSGLVTNVGKEYVYQNRVRCVAGP